MVTILVFPQHVRRKTYQIHHTHTAIARSFQAVSSSVFAVLVIALERAFALLCPLRHRVTSTKTYIYSVFVVWMGRVNVTLGAMNVLVSDDLLKQKIYIKAYCSILALSLVLTRVLYFAIRTRLSHRGQTFGATRNKKITEQTRKLSKTLFTVIAVSFLLWIPSLVMYYAHLNRLKQQFHAKNRIYIGSMLHLTNSLTNPLFYSLRMPMFKETLTRLKDKSTQRVSSNLLKQY